MSILNNCSLCEAKKLSHWFHEDERVWVAECITCHDRMLVFKKHNINLTKDDHQYAELIFSHLWPNWQDIYRLDKNQKAIKDHPHFHLRRK